MRYGPDRLVLEGLNLEVADGESLAVMGPSGSGKTTLISILGLLVEPSAGSVTIDGSPGPSRESQRHRVRSELFGWVLQTVNVLGRRTALDNVSIPLLSSGFTRDQAAMLARDALETVGLGGHVDQPVRLLSGGEVQRVCIARALAHRPRYLLADEPTGQLDHNTSTEVLNGLKHLLTDAGSALVVVTHDPQVADLCARTVDLVDGKAVLR
jgi:ABC-type lipoprotein export system ATPase subunit